MTDPDMYKDDQVETTVGLGTWSVLINSLTDKPENHAHPPRHRTDPRHDVSQMQAAKKGESQAEVLRAIAEYGGAASAMSIQELVPNLSYKYLCAVCRQLELDGRLTSYIKVEGMARRKYWKLV